MKSFASAVFIAAMVLTLATHASASEQSLPKLTLLKDDREVTSRLMTKTEHTLYLKMRHAMSSMAVDADYATLTDASIKMAKDGIETAVRALTDTRQRHDHNEHAEASDDVHVIGDVYQAHADMSFAELANRIEDESSQIAKFAERMAASVEAFEKEVASNSKGIEYSHIRVGDGEDALTLEN